jgi:hypothetical protein
MGARGGGVRMDPPPCSPSPLSSLDTLKRKRTEYTNKMENSDNLLPTRLSQTLRILAAYPSARQPAVRVQFVLRHCQKQDGGTIVMIILELAAALDSPGRPHCEGIKAQSRHANGDSWIWP